MDDLRTRIVYALEAEDLRVASWSEFNLGSFAADGPIHLVRYTGRQPVNNITRVTCELVIVLAVSRSSEAIDGVGLETAEKAVIDALYAHTDDLYPELQATQIIYDKEMSLLQNIDPRSGRKIANQYVASAMTIVGEPI